MSYQIGQFKRTDLGTTEYETELKDIQNNLIPLKIGYTENTPYGNNSKDGKVFLENHNFMKGTIYRLRTTLYSSSFSGKVKIKLKDNNNKYQILKIININNSYLLDLIFIPQYDFSSIVFEIERDVNIANNENIYVYAVDNLNTKITKMTNVLTTNKISVNKIKKLGIQGPEGMLFAINGELLKMGKSKIFMSEEMEITSVCFIIENKPNNSNEEDPFYYEKNKTFFIMDYQY